MQDLKGLKLAELADRAAKGEMDAVRLELVRRIEKGGASAVRAAVALSFIDTGLRESISWS